MESIPNIYAIGDITGNPMLAHKATHEAKTAAENIAGLNSDFEPTAIPSVIYTNPEIAWTGHTELELKNKNIEYNIKDLYDLFTKINFITKK